jgi:hypothetical protein
MSEDRALTQPRRVVADRASAANDAGEHKGTTTNFSSYTRREVRLIERAAKKRMLRVEKVRSASGMVVGFRMQAPDGRWVTHIDDDGNPWFA